MFDSLLQQNAQRLYGLQGLQQAQQAYPGLAYPWQVATTSCFIGNFPPPQALGPRGTPQKGRRTMFQEVKTAIQEFFVEHKQTIIWIAVLLLVDKFFFAGKFTTKLHALIDGMIEKIETKVKGAL